MDRQCLKQTLTVALPIILTQLASTITGFIGLAFLSRLGHTVLAASALLFSLQTMFLIVGISPLFALSVLISRAFGSGNKKEIGNILQQSWLLGLILSAVIFALYSFIAPILHVFEQSSELITIIKPYFIMARWGIPATLIAVACSQFLLGVGKQQLVFVISVVQTVILVMLGYTFIFGHFGVVQLGVKGWGIAYTITDWCMLGIILAIFYFQHDFKKFYIFHVHMSNSLQHLKELFQFGWPICMQTGGELLSFAFIMIMVGWLGNVSLAAMVVTQFLMIVVKLPAYGFSTGAGILVGCSMGEKNFAQAKMFGTINFLLCVSVIATFGMIISIFSVTLSHVFLNPHEEDYQQILELIQSLFLLIVISQIFDSARSSLTGALRGLLDMRFPMMVGLISIWIIRIPLSYILAFKLHMGVVGIAKASVFAMAIAAIIVLWRWQQKTKTF